jgi:ATP-dependent DNA ligase
MLEALVRLPVRSLIIDAELVACDDAGVPHYYALHFHSRKYGLCAWAFDLLHLSGKASRPDHGSTRKERQTALRGNNSEGGGVGEQSAYL